MSQRKRSPHELGHHVKEVARQPFDSYFSHTASIQLTDHNLDLEVTTTLHCYLSMAQPPAKRARIARSVTADLGHVLRLSTPRE